MPIQSRRAKRRISRAALAACFVGLGVLAFAVFGRSLPRLHAERPSAVQPTVEALQRAAEPAARAETATLAIDVAAEQRRDQSGSPPAKKQAASAPKAAQPAANSELLGQHTAHIKSPWQARSAEGEPQRQPAEKRSVWLE
jgi:hypothetical protein